MPTIKGNTLISLFSRLSYSQDLETNPNRLNKVNVRSKHTREPKSWAAWAAKHPPLNHHHLDPPRKPVSDAYRASRAAGGRASSYKGTRRGYGGHRHLQDLCDRKAFEEGKRIVSVMIKRGLVDKEQTGNEALAYAIGVVRTDDIPVSSRLQAAKMVMDFTLAKPTEKKDLKVTVESFLEELADEANQHTEE